MIQVRSNRGLLQRKQSVYSPSIALYDEPDDFRPERFLESQYGTKKDADVSDFRDNLAFGSGRVSAVVQTSPDPN